MSTFAVHERAEPDGAIRLSFVGEIDLAASQTLDAHWQNLALGTPRLLRLDLTAVTFIDVAGLRAVITLSRRARDAGHRVVVDEHLPRQVRRIVELAHAESYLRG